MIDHTSYLSHRITTQRKQGNSGSEARVHRLGFERQQIPNIGRIRRVTGKRHQHDTKLSAIGGQSAPIAPILCA
jgi:hypothetical protein